jgi:monoamine oxidase
MNRRFFLKQTSFVSIGGLVVPSTVLSSCVSDSLFEDINYTGKVIVIGAGAAGLYATYLLKSKGVDCQLLEAANIYGGRLGKITGFADYPLDKGAQWLHGKNSLVGDLVAKTQTPITLDNGDTKYWFNNQLVTNLPKDVEAIFEDEDAPDVSYKDHAHQQGFGNEYDNLVESIAGDSGASAANISVYWKLIEEENWVAGDQDFKFQQTFFDLIDQHIAAEVIDKLVLNAAVKKIDYSSPTIVVMDTNNINYTADKVIITVPITILKNNSIQFIPALPPDKTTAFNKIGMDPGMKVFLKFNQKFYDENIIGGNICAAYADESIGKTGNDHVLLAFIMGQQANYLTSLGSDTAITNALLAELDLMYAGQASASFISSHVENWTTKPYIQGAYSFSTVGIGTSRQKAAEPINNQLYFAGEAMNINGNHQSVHGAIETGYREVINIFDSVNK